MPPHSSREGVHLKSSQESPEVSPRSRGALISPRRSLVGRPRVSRRAAIVQKTLEVEGDSGSPRVPYQVLSLAFVSGDQVASGGADGVLKLWSPKTSRCECTLDAHPDSKLWALCARPATDGDDASRPARLATGGGDGAVRLWRDATREDDAAARATADDVVRREQVLRDALRKGDYALALAEAMALDRPHTAWTALSALGGASSAPPDDGTRYDGFADGYARVVHGFDLPTALKCLHFCKAQGSPRAQNGRSTVERLSLWISPQEALERSPPATLERVFV